MQTTLRRYIETFVIERSLTVREKEIFILILQGAVTHDELSQILKISQNTIRIHLRNIKNKCASRNRVELLVNFINFLSQCHDESENIKILRAGKKAAV